MTVCATTAVRVAARIIASVNSNILAKGSVRKARNTTMRWVAPGIHTDAWITPLQTYSRKRRDCDFDWAFGCCAAYKRAARPVRDCRSLPPCFLVGGYTSIASCAARLPGKRLLSFSQVPHLSLFFGQCRRSMTGVPDKRWSEASKTWTKELFSCWNQHPGR